MRGNGRGLVLSTALVLVTAASCRMIVGIDDRTVAEPFESGTDGANRGDAIAGDAADGHPPDDAGIDARVDAPYPAFSPDLPTIHKSSGPVIVSPHFVSITFPGYPYATDVATLPVDMQTAGYWAATVAEYGVTGPVTADAVAVNENAPATIDMGGVQQWLSAKLTADAGGFGPPDPSTVYSIFYPTSTSFIAGVSDGGVVDLCSFGDEGYNDELTVGATSVAYAVILQCGGGLDTLTAAASGIWTAALTDPFPATNPAYASCDGDNAAWNLFGTCQVGDLCTVELPYVYTDPSIMRGLTFAWSNQAALAGHDPCVPRATGDVYFGSVPKLPDSVMLNPGRQPIATKGVLIPPGQSKTIDVDLFSTAPTGGSWTVKALEYNSSDLTFAWDRTSGQNGDVLHLTISVVAQPRAPFQTFIIGSTLGSSTNKWPAVVANR